MLVNKILEQHSYSKDDICTLLEAEGEQQRALHAKANSITLANRGIKVYYRGLLEFSNICVKDCYYCGIRKSNNEIERYNLDDEAIVSSAMFALNNRYGSVVLQSGENNSRAFIERVDNLVRRIKFESGNKLGITLSLGEQSYETYARWYESGAHRYLLRVETSNEELYRQLHPAGNQHSFKKRVEALRDLKKIGYRTGTGVMVGLPGQTIDHLAEDILFMKQLDIDMAGMGPYIAHEQTPLLSRQNELWPTGKRLSVSLNMVAMLRLVMPGINIAATTALQAIDPVGREKALKAGANIIMPNITPAPWRKHYALYNNKPCILENASECSSCVSMRVNLAGKETGWDEWGDPVSFTNNIKKEGKR